jgi:predicted lipoprotein
MAVVLLFFAGVKLSAKSPVAEVSAKKSRKNDAIGQLNWELFVRFLGCVMDADRNAATSTPWEALRHDPEDSRRRKREFLLRT